MSTLFDTLPDGRDIRAFTLENENGVRLTAIELGATITSLEVPDRDGRIDDIVLGLKNAQDYLEQNFYLGAVVGRYANRIAGAMFAIDDEIHSLAANDGPHHLHGGNRGFDKRLWSGEQIQSDTGQAARFTLTSADGEEAYPGELTVSVTYELDGRNRLRISFAASTTAATVINLSQHSYFNLAGHNHGTILNHELKISADSFTPADSTLIPTGEVRSVHRTPFDFSNSKKVGRDIGVYDEQLLFGQGYDHNFVLSKVQDVGGLWHAATLYDPASGRVMIVRTDQPGLQLYTGNNLDGSLAGKAGAVYRSRSALCLETQHFPNSPNNPEFPSTLLQPGEKFSSTTTYEFQVRG